MKGVIRSNKPQRIPCKNAHGARACVMYAIKVVNIAK